MVWEAGRCGKLRGMLGEGLWSGWWVGKGE